MQLIPYYPVTNQTGYAYVYKIINTITNEFYFGSRYSEKFMQTSSPINDFWKSYFTSSDIVKAQINQYGKQAFAVNIIYTSMSKEDVFMYEQDLIKQNKDNELILNKLYIIVNSFGKASRLTTKSKAFKTKISSVQKGRERSEKEKYNSSMLQLSKRIQNYQLNNLEDFRNHIRDLFFNYNMTALDIAKHLNLCKSTIHNHLTKYLSKEEKAWNRKRIVNKSADSRCSTYGYQRHSF